MTQEYYRPALELARGNETVAARLRELEAR
jgi:hypothetical protein